MNYRIKKIMHGFFHALSANVIRLLISIVLTLFLPRILGVKEYSYWQLYLFYVTYTAYSSLGFCEGTYLKYGGKEFRDLPSQKMSAQFWSLAIYEVFICLVGLGFAFCFVNDENRKYIIALALVSSVFDILRYQLQTVLQATNRIDQFAKVMTLERILFFVFSGIPIVLGFRDFYFLIFAEIMARVISMVYATVVCKNIVFVKFTFNKESFLESKELISSGIKLLLALLASQLVIGIVRFFIEKEWGTIIFGKVSLTLSLSNMIITCIGAISVVLFPILKNIEDKKLEKLYETLRMLLTVPTLFVLLFYVPMKLILVAWLPQYEDTLKYLAILLPICVYETRCFALVQTYLKAYRKENQILISNVIIVMLSFAFSIFTVNIMQNLEWAVVSILVLIILKSLLLEYFLSKSVEIKSLMDNILEIILTFIFVGSSFYLNHYASMLIYFLAYGIYLFVCRKRIVLNYQHMKAILFKKDKVDG